ncbi:hypothetical protein FDP41_008495 [Naegleria fowleri]|uniref:RNB domain-containing protein n=1 Tax=Naegleria fowleri TaxID=5763 RepID=A0A6A5BGY1_NAEFO|nr:uncharacterized protein FDP41_008495 [Naegleria fowleri]KAF0973288.1 hypothetical protein FDP41_008495 [Naegleria fowleri]
MSKNTHHFKKYTGGLSQSSISMLTSNQSLPNPPTSVKLFNSESFSPSSSSNSSQPTTTTPFTSKSSSSPSSNNASPATSLSSSYVRNTKSSVQLPPNAQTDAFNYKTYHYNNYTYYASPGQTPKQRYQPHHHNANAPNPYYDEEAFFLQQEPGGADFAASSSNILLTQPPIQQNDGARKKLQYIGSRIYKKTNSTSSALTSSTPSVSCPSSPSKNRMRESTTSQFGKRAFHSMSSFTSPGSVNLSRAFKEESKQQHVIVEYDDEFERRLAIITGPESLDENNNKWIIIDITGRNRVVNSSQLTYQFSSDNTDQNFNIDDVRQLQAQSSAMIEKLTPEDCDNMWKAFLQRKSVKITIKDAAEHLFQSTEPASLYSAYRFLYKNPLYFKHTSNLNFECRSLREVEELKQMGSKEKETILKDKIFLLKIANRLLATNEERGLFYKQLRNNVMKEIKAMRPDLEITREFLEIDEEQDKERLSLFRQYALGMYTNLDNKKRVYEAFFKPLGADDHLQAFRVARDLKLFTTQNIHLLRSMEDEMCHMKEEDNFKKIVRENIDSIVNSTDPDSKIRRDLRHLPVFTIDEYPKTTEVDDGVSVEVRDGATYMYIHIADVTRFINQGSTIDYEAQKRVSSIYLPEKKFNMISSELSEDVLSLSDKKENYSLTFSSKVGSDGSLSEWQAFPAILGKVQKIDYSLADQIIDKTVEVDPEVYDAFQLMLQVANLRFAYRMRKGATPPSLSPKPKVDVSNSEQSIQIGTSWEEQVGSSRRLVQEFMIAANEIGGHYALQHDIAVPYRGTRTVTMEIPPLPEEEINQILSLSPKISEKDLCDVVVRSNNSFFPTAGVCINQSPKFHQGIGSSTYVQVTSPIRRYSDLLVHYQLKAQMRGEKQPYTWDEIQEILFAIEPTTRAIASLQKKSERFWLLKYFEQNLTTHSGRNNRYKALVLESKKNAITSLDPDELPFVLSLYLIESAFRASVKSSNSYEVGDFLDVKVSSVSPYNDEISFEEITK